MKSETIVRACCVQLLGALTISPALAANEQVITPYLGYAFSHEDNVLGLTDNAAGDGDSSNSRQASAGVVIDKRVSQQAFTAALHFTRIRYDRLPELDHDAKDLRGNWNWRVGTKVDGNLGATYVKALAPFVSFKGRARNVRAEARQFADGGWLLHPSWRLRAGVLRSSIDYELPAQQGGDRDERTAELGFDYVARSGSTVGTQLRRTRGDYPNRQLIDALLVDNSFEQDELKVKVSWLVTRMTQLQFLGGPVRRKHNDFPQRDYSGVNSRLNMNWQTTPKLSMAVGAWREIGALDDISASYTLNQGVNLGAVWDVSAKVRIDGQLRHETSDYSGTAALSESFADRKDRIRSAVVKLVYRATPHMVVGLQAYRNTRQSNVPGNSYPGSGANLSLKYEF